MSELRIGLVAEGVTDHIAIEAALRAILPRPFVLTRLQPEATRPDIGGGWCGVLKWCGEQRGRGCSCLERDPSLELFDWIVLHLDADVADKTYADCGNEIEARAQAADFGILPCSGPCPPSSNAASSLRIVLSSWLGVASIGPRTLLCLPSKDLESWIAVVVLPHSHALIASDIECVKMRLSQLPKQVRTKKTASEYRTLAPKIAAQWAEIRVRCEQAERFHRDVEAVYRSLDRPCYSADGRS
jgi:hypothetical protein